MQLLSPSSIWGSPAPAYKVHQRNLHHWTIRWRTQNAALDPLAESRQARSQAFTLLAVGALTKLHCSCCFCKLYNRRRGKLCKKATCGPAAELNWASKGDVGDGACSTASAVMRVPVRKCRKSVGLRRFTPLLRKGEGIPISYAPILLVHDGPGLPSTYLEPLAERISKFGTRTCYTYDQLGCGLSCSESVASSTTRFDFKLHVHDLKDVLSFLTTELGEISVHLVAHGYGGMLVMEALLRAGLWVEDKYRSSMPELRSVCLIGSPNSTNLAEAEAKKLMQKVESEDLMDQSSAPFRFWRRHVCAVYPQPLCLRQAYQNANHQCRNESRMIGALQGWRWCHQNSSWELHGGGAMQGWEISQDEVAASYSSMAGAPLLNIRGSHDFITESCTVAWRGVSNWRASFYREQVVGGCGHHPHIESPRVFSLRLTEWFHHADALCKSTRDSSPDCSDAGSSNSVQHLQNPMQLRLLTQEETRQQLTKWASDLSWADAELQEEWSFACRARSNKSVARYWVSPSPAREARRLAEWTRHIPESTAWLNASATSIQRILAGALFGHGSHSGSGLRVAVGCTGRGPQDLQAVVCIESQASTMHTKHYHVVGAAASLSAPIVARDAAVYQVSQMVSELQELVHKSERN